MLRTVAVVVIGLGILAANACGQSGDPYARTEVTAGFSVVRLGDGSHPELYGGPAGMTSNFTRNFGVVSDFAGQYKNGISIRQSLFGPRFTQKWGSKTLFGHALAGVSREGGSNAFTLGPGGGFALQLSNRFAVRPIQVDWLPARTQGKWSTNRVRAGSAIMISFSRR